MSLNVHKILFNNSMSMAKKEIVVIPRMPKKPPPVVYYYIDDECKGQEGIKVSDIAKKFKNLSVDVQKKYKVKSNAAWEKYREDVADWRKKADELGYFENVEYSGKDIEDVISKLHLNVDVEKCKTLLGKVAGLWMVKIVKAYQVIKEKKGLEDLNLIDFLNDEKILKESSIFKNTIKFVGKTRPVDYVKKVNEIDSLEEKVRSSDTLDKMKKTKQLTKDYKSNDISAIMKGKDKGKEKDKKK